jgi:hypothetical protein
VIPFLCDPIPDLTDFILIKSLKEKEMKMWIDGYLGDTNGYIDMNIRSLSSENQIIQHLHSQRMIFPQKRRLNSFSS